jgi:uncharacterized protein
MVEPEAVMDWRNNLVREPAEARRLLLAARRIAVLGMKPDHMAGEAAHYVPAYLQREGYQIVPVPVYYPDEAEMLGEPVYRNLADLPEPVDMVVVFRRPADVPGHLEELVAARPGVVWMQAGISHAAAAEHLARAGIRVVQNRCTMIEHRLASRG